MPEGYSLLLPPKSLSILKLKNLFGQFELMDYQGTLMKTVMEESRKIVMPQSAKHFAERLNKCLTDTDAPANARERAAILSKMLDISKHQAWSLLEGHTLPDEVLIEQIANEFEVDPNWLAGEK